MKSDFRDWIGKTVVRTDVVSERLVEQYRVTLAPHLFSMLCPPGLHWCLGVAAPELSSLGPDGAEAKGVFLPPVPLPRRMWAGGRIETFHSLSIGDPITRTSRVADVQWRDGKSGPMCIVSVSHDFNVQGRTAIRERHDILFRDGGMAGARAAGALPPHDIEWKVEASPTLLFRFSAVTFNGHRIHYDLPYTRDVEGYDGLLVHGPLQAALALNQAAVVLGQVPIDFSYRCVAPLLGGQVFRVMSRKTGDVVEVIVCDAAGVITLEAEAQTGT